MKSQFFFLIILVILFYSAASSQEFEARNTTGMKWYKGNVHTHAREGESDSSAEYAIKWYKDHNYQFLVITDHSTITLPPLLSNLADSSFLLIPGEEITGYGNKAAVEINALNIHEAILPLYDETVLGALQKCIDTVRQVQAIPVINHPNFQWRLDQNTLLGSRDCNIFELYNGFPGTYSYGDDGHPGLEKVWDFLLTSGKRIYGVASDDAHSYKEFSPELSNPGRGWVVVRSKCLDTKEIVQNLDSGLFYSSTGVEILDLRIEPHRIEIIIKDTENKRYKTDFIGSAGSLLHSTKNNPAVYNLSSESNYVRAKITDTDGHCAWMQPVFVVK